MKKIKYDRFQPCEHKGCLNHMSHPCEGCGRIGGDEVVYEEDYKLDFEFITRKGNYHENKIRKRL